jgi:hypothetical protein
MLLLHVRVRLFQAITLGNGGLELLVQDAYLLLKRHVLLLLARLFLRVVTESNGDEESQACTIDHMVGRARRARYLAWTIALLGLSAAENAMSRRPSFLPLRNSCSRDKRCCCSTASVHFNASLCLCSICIGFEQLSGTVGGRDVGAFTDR